ncbi:MAG: hypothetical protein A3D15_03300 [Alphaproteobacteria bacterium RIFCSPHIGHO2_02_FULL_40_34]|nr:MAG: hypothetical protein A3D15_03300 [Alphaproteobacteria bacterium RIFCSPHIGHO2_02_FULL_40_34]OFX11060.1 MAG: hypothetical protein A3G22_01395 [Alphaproteobacteria bacterium RIFCSPLOWO2_12_FULL_40_11]
MLNRIKFFYFDEDYDSIDVAFGSSNFDLVFHLAAFGNYEHESSAISRMIDSNIKLGAFILEAMKNHGCKNIVSTSTYWQHYGGKKKYEPIALYAATKKSFENIIEYYAISSGIKAITLKLYDVYGYGDHRKKFINSLFSAENGAKYDLTEGRQLFYMVFIDDVVDGYLTAAQLVSNRESDLDGYHKVYALRGKEKYSLRQIVAMIFEISKKSFSANWGGKPYYPLQIMRPYSEKILPGWTSKTSLRDGIKIIIKNNSL